ncbi:MAG: DNRLRE domain-containing protein [Tepidisphaera sp.]|nr:DNRLRE domain-containing protein [Tepidisphaera sp.]
MTSHLHTLALSGVLTLAAGAAMATQTITADAANDNTMYQFDPTQGETALSNGSGGWMFAGMTASNSRRRALVRFDIADLIPPGSTIVSATLTLHMSRTIAGFTPVTIHRVQASWGEGTSVAFGDQGAGAGAKTDDATWIDRFYESGLVWQNPGGDFDAAPSATTQVGDVGFYSWSSPQMVAEVQTWLSNPGTNFGWVVVGDETQTATAKRFDTHENAEPTFRPALVIEYNLPSTCDPDVNQDGVADQGDVDYLINVIAGGENPTGIDPDFNQDGVADQGDIDALVNVIAGGQCP